MPVLLSFQPQPGHAYQRVDRQWHAQMPLHPHPTTIFDQTDRNDNCYNKSIALALLPAEGILLLFV
jgi:hypothetical protein